MPRQTQITSRLAAAIVAGVIMATAAGCYRHVVRESGPGRGSDEIHEPNLKEDGPVDRLLYGDESPDRP